MKLSSRRPSHICLLEFLEIIASANQVPLHSPFSSCTRKLFQKFSSSRDFHKTKLKLETSPSVDSHHPRAMTRREWRWKCWSMGKLKIIILNKQKPIVGRDIFGYSEKRLVDMNCKFDSSIWWEECFVCNAIQINILQCFTTNVDFAREMSNFSGILINLDCSVYARGSWK